MTEDRDQTEATLAEAVPSSVSGQTSSAPPNPPVPGRSAESGEGFFARLAQACKGFLQGWRGELLEVPAGEEGTIPLAQLRAVERQYEKKLSKAQSALEGARDESANWKKQVIELEAQGKESGREIKRLRAVADETEKSLQSELSKLQTRLQERDASLSSLQEEIARLKKIIREREQALDEVKKNLEDALAKAARQAAELEENAKKSFLDAQRREEQIRAEAAAALAQLRGDLANREGALTQLNTRMEEMAANHAGILASLKKELDNVREALAQREAANDMLLNEVAEHENAADQAQENAARAQAEAKEEIERLEAQLQSSEQAKEKLRSELIAALPEKVAAADLRLKISVAEKDYQRKVEEADMLREDLRELRKRMAEYEGKVGGLEETESQRAGLQRELQRQAAQLEAVRSQLEETRLQAEKLRAAVQEFHAPAVSAVQVAGVYAETVAGSLALSESDRADIIEIKQNMDALRTALQKLAAKLAETDSSRANS